MSDSGPHPVHVKYVKAASSVLDAAFILFRDTGEHDSFPYLFAVSRRPLLIGLILARAERGAAIVEMALVLPLLLALLMGMLVYGQYFQLAHSVQQAANDGARAAITGLEAADRSAAATRAVARSLQEVTGTHRVAVSETNEAITVAVTFTTPPDSFLRSTLVPSPTNVIRSRAIFELPAD